MHAWFHQLAGASVSFVIIRMMLAWVCFLPQKFSLHPPVSGHRFALCFEAEAAPKSLSWKQQENILPTGSSWEVLAWQQSSSAVSCKLGAGRGLRKGWKSASPLNISGAPSQIFFWVPSHSQVHPLTGKCCFSWSIFPFSHRRKVG